jgi:uncharacterized protein YjbJ (UPF0337 family)
VTLADRITTRGAVSLGHLPGISEELAAFQVWVRRLSTRKEAVVSLANKIRNKAQELRGRGKWKTGEVTGDWRLQVEGRVDEVIANLKQAGEKVKDAFRGRGPRRRPY